MRLFFFLEQAKHDIGGVDRQEQLENIIVYLNGTRSRSPKDKTMRNHRRSAIVGAVVVVALLVIGSVIFLTPIGYPIRDRLFPTPEPTPTAQMTPTIDSGVDPDLRDAGVTFNITSSEGDSIKVFAGDTLTLMPSESFQLKMTVTVDGSPFPRELIYRYSAPVGRVSEEFAGPATSYVAPNQPGTDIIGVLITDPTNGRQISRSINVIIQEN